MRLILAKLLTATLGACGGWSVYSFYNHQRISGSSTEEEEERREDEDDYEFHDDFPHPFDEWQAEQRRLNELEKPAASDPAPFRFVSIVHAADVDLGRAARVSLASNWIKRSERLNADDHIESFHRSLGQPETRLSTDLMESDGVSALLPAIQVASSYFAKFRYEMVYHWKNQTYNYKDS